MYNNEDCTKKEIIMCEETLPVLTSEKQKVFEGIFSTLETTRQEILSLNVEIEPILKKVLSEKWCSEIRELRKVKSLLSLLIEKIDYLILFFSVTPVNNPATIKLLVARLSTLKGLSLVNSYILKKESFENKLT